MPRLSPTDCVGPAFGRVKLMLFQPFRISTWLKMGFIGWLAGGFITMRIGFRGPVMPLQFPRERLPRDPVEEINRLIRAVQAHENFVALLIALAIIGLVLGVVFLYLFCRFRFILFDSVLSARAAVGRGWRGYSPQANRYFGFWFVYALVKWGTLGVVVGLPLWRAYKNGLFQGANPVGAIVGLVATVGFALFSLAIVFSIVSTLLTDFILPLMALDDLSFAAAWSAVRELVAAEPGSWAGYMGLKLVLALATGIGVSIASVFLVLALLVVLVIPVGLLGGIGVVLMKTAGPAGLAMGGFLIGVAVLFVIAAVISLVLFVIAPVSVFFSAYALYFFGGRYPKLGALLWPQTPSGLTPQPLPTGTVMA